MKSWLFALIAAVCVSSPVVFGASAEAPKPTDLMVGSPPPAANQVTQQNWMGCRTTSGRSITSRRWSERRQSIAARVR